MKTSRWIVFVFLAIVVGVYPLAYLVFDMSSGLLGTKEPALLERTSRFISTSFSALLPCLLGGYSSANDSGTSTSPCTV